MSKIQIFFLIMAIALIAIGSRLSLIDRFCSTIPYADDWNLIDSLEKTKEEIPISYLFENHNKNHLHVFTKLVPMVTILTNGLMDRKQDALVHLFVFICLGTTLFLYFKNYIEKSPKLFLFFLSMFLLIPLAGARQIWPFLICFDTMVMFSFLAFYFAVKYDRQLFGMLICLFFGLLACLSLGSGVLCFAAIGGSICIGAVQRGRWSKWDTLWILVCSTILGLFFIKIFQHTEAREFALHASISSFFKVLSWPMGFSEEAEKTGHTYSGFNFNLNGLVYNWLNHVVELLSLLKSQWSSVLRDREIVCVATEPGQEYHLELRDEGSGWFAFSNPREGGRNTFWVLPLLQSGKLLMLLGFCFLTLSCLFSTFCSDLWKRGRQ